MAKKHWRIFKNTQCYLGLGQDPGRPTIEFRKGSQSRWGYHPGLPSLVVITSKGRSRPTLAMQLLFQFGLSWWKAIILLWKAASTPDLPQQNVFFFHQLYKVWKLMLQIPKYNMHGNSHTWCFFFHYTDEAYTSHLELLPAQWNHA